jgi:hypothetical protein
MLEWLTGVPPEETRFPARDLAGAALDSDPVTSQIFVVNGKNSLPTRESTDPRPVMAIFGGTTEIQKEIIARGLGLWPDQVFYELRAPGFWHDARRKVRTGPVAEIHVRQCRTVQSRGSVLRPQSS